MQVGPSDIDMQDGGAGACKCRFMQVQVEAQLEVQVQVWYVIKTLLWHDRTRDIADLNHRNIRRPEARTEANMFEF